MKNLYTSLLAIGTVLLFSNLVAAEPVPKSKRSKAAVARVVPQLRRDVEEEGFVWGAPVFVRIFKEEEELEVWLKDGQIFRKFQTFDICTWSGDLGPKLKEGDGQSPEGFYQVKSSAMNPASSFHLSFNLGFPNAYDRAHGRTGSYLMVHGSCVSVGCYAMRNLGIEKIWTLASAALEEGQDAFDVHIFPFRMNETNMKKVEGERWEEFWKNLKEGHDLFEESRQVPGILLEGRRYKFG